MREQPRRVIQTLIRVPIDSDIHKEYIENILQEALTKAKMIGWDISSEESIHLKPSEHF